MATSHRVGLLIATLVLPAGTTLVRADHVAAGSYTFTNIVDSSGPFIRFTAPRIDAGGTLVFLGFLDAGGEGIFTGRGGPITTIAASNTPPMVYPPRPMFYPPAVNAGGRVAFLAVGDGMGIFTGRGGPTTTIADTGGPFFIFNEWFAINPAGTVAFFAGLDDGRIGAGGNPTVHTEGIFTGRGGPITTIADSNGPFTFFRGVDISAGGTVAFGAGLNTGEEGIFASRHGKIVTIADTSGPFAFFGVGLEINSRGTVAFVGIFDDSVDEGIFTGNGGPIGTVVDTFGPFSAVGLVGINARGMVAFGGVFDPDFTGHPVNPRHDLPDSGIFTGPDPLADKVIGTGDALFGSTVIALYAGGHSLNDAGQIAFGYDLADGRSGIARADPDPGQAAEAGRSDPSLALAVTDN